MNSSEPVKLGINSQNTLQYRNACGTSNNGDKEMQCASPRFNVFNEGSTNGTVRHKSRTFKGKNACKKCWFVPCGSKVAYQRNFETWIDRSCFCWSILFFWATENGWRVEGRIQNWICLLHFGPSIHSSPLPQWHTVADLAMSNAQVEV